MMAAGMDVQIISFDSTKGKNVVGCLPGQTSKFLLAGAHYDTLPHPPAVSPGAMDNGSGVAVMMQTMKALTSKQFEHTLCIAAFDGEELGLHGSSEIAKQIASNEKLKSNFLGAITSDMSTGFHTDCMNAGGHAGWTSDNSKMVQRGKAEDQDGIHIDGNEASRELIAKFSEAAVKSVVDKQMPIMESTASIWNSDHKSFLHQHLPAIDICAANHRVYRYWHSDKNQTSCLDPQIGAEISRTTIRAVAEMLDMKGDSTGKALEENPKENIPKFEHSKTPTEEFGTLDCSVFAARTGDTPSHVTAHALLGMARTVPHIHKLLHRRTHRDHEELIRMLDETIDALSPRE
jgi:hypothetical protein